MKVFIDTQLWVYSFKKPQRDAFESESQYREAVDMHNKSRALIRRSLSRDTVFMSTHQLAEIYHALAFRGVRIGLREALAIMENIMGSSRIVVVEVKRNHFRRAIKLSSLSGIHVWDYLCLLPLSGIVDVAYTNDRHFLHPTLSGLVPKIENPVGKWVTL